MPQLYGEHSWQIPNQLGPATAMTRDALKWANAFPISDQAKYSLRLALEEMLSNTVKYGYAGGFGIELVRRICRHMGYRREQNRNRVTLHIESADLDFEVDSELAASKEMSP